MSQTNHQLRENARKLALKHIVVKGSPDPHRFWNRFAINMDSLRHFVDAIHSKPSACGQLAEDWLLDNAEFIEEQALEVELNFTPAFLKNLPAIEPDRRPRVQNLVEDYLTCVDGLMTEETLILYCNAYQDVSALTLAEIRAIPLMLRICLIRGFAKTMAEVRARKEVCHNVADFLCGFHPQTLSAERIARELEYRGQGAPLSGPWIVHLISHLRETAEDNNELRQWLNAYFENSGTDLDQIISYEHQLQTGYQMTAGHIITSLRNNERRSWEDFFNQVCLIDQQFRQEPTGVYPLMDELSRNTCLNRVEVIARKMRVTENLIAKHVIQLAKSAYQNELIRNIQPDRYDRSTFIAYYLFERKGIAQLGQSLKQVASPKKHHSLLTLTSPTQGYLSVLIMTFLVLTTLFYNLVTNNHLLTGWQMLLIAGGCALLASEWTVNLLHFVIETVVQPQPLLRYDFSNGIPSEAKTLVVIPVIWSSKEEVQEIVNKLELHHMSTRDRHIDYAILSDFTDAQTAVMASDQVIIDFANQKIQDLNKQYNESYGSRFYLFQRQRQWNSKENVYMGWERKRGKLVEFVELLKGSRTTSYNLSDYRAVEELKNIPYLITLDADTEMPLETARKMIATMHLPYNRPRLNEAGTCVVEGFGVLQPRVDVSHTSSLQTKLAYLWTEAGLDPYAFIASDPYQDAIGHGIFTGKGIFHMDAFAQTICQRIPENQILSHDLLEGGFLRAGFLSDVGLIDDHPNTFSAYQKRQHRWVRGDWQLLSWLTRKNKDRKGIKRKVELPMITRWQIIDNLRRSVMPIGFICLLIANNLLSIGTKPLWLLLIFTTMFYPFFKQIIVVLRGGWQKKAAISTGMTLLINFWVLPFQAAVLLHAITISLFRFFITRKNLLEWTSSSHIERLHNRSTQPTLQGMAGGYTFILLFGLTAIQQGTPALWNNLYIYLLCLFWALAPLGIRRLDQPVIQSEFPIPEDDKAVLQKLAQDIWQFYEDFTTEENHWLTPDNVQIEPDNGVAERTSPTNIGFYLMAIQTAYHFGFIKVENVIEKTRHTITTIENLTKWHGHLYNWYNTKTKEVLHPNYVSTVDSGNFIASLMTVKEGLVSLQKQTPDEAQKQTLQQLIDRTEKIIVETDFRQLYDDKAKLFVLGYNGVSEQCDEILYDLLASEARQTSFVAIALGQVPVAHWLTLGRSTKKQGKRKTLISWSGTMFEYLMPWLLMKTYPNTIWESTYHGIVDKQIQFAHSVGVPFGISESGYYAFDHQMNYQYQAFGVPGTGFKRGLEDELVLAPYATIMALPFATKTALQDLGRMDQLGARGQYGFYEAIDFTNRRLPSDRHYMIVQSFMAHHQGMALLTLANLLLPEKMTDYFHQDKRVQSAELLLKERIPAKISIRTREIASQAVQSKQQSVQQERAHTRRFDPSRGPVEVNVHSNGRLTSLVNTLGGGFLRYNDIAITRFREGIRQEWGNFLYLHNPATQQIWSPTIQPCQSSTDVAQVYFTLERSKFTHKHQGIQTTVEICVPPKDDVECRRIQITNTTNEPVELVLTTYQELALAPQKTDEAHPAFSKLFIETEFAAEVQALLARKRPRHAGEPPVWAVQTFFVEQLETETVKQESDSFEFETDRNAFIERGHTLAMPKGITSPLAGATGAVTDPAFILRRKVSIEPGGTRTLFTVTGAAESKKAALDLAEEYNNVAQIAEAFKQAWTWSHIEMRHFHATPIEVATSQQLLSRVLYPVGYTKEKRQAIQANQKSQENLWTHGISGDTPIVLIRVSNSAGLRFVDKLINHHSYLRRNGIRLSFVFINESKEGYQRDIFEAIRRLIEKNIGVVQKQAGKLHVVNEENIGEEIKTLLYAMARLVLKADGASLRNQLRVKNTPSLQQQTWVTKGKPVAETRRTHQPPVQFFNGSGGFTADGKNYQIQQMPPAPWINVLANPNFGTIVSDRMTGYTWWRNSRECKLTPWSNDPTLDPSGEQCLLFDASSGNSWRLGEASIATHGFGYTKFEQMNHAIRQTATVFVPIEDPIKIIEIQLENQTREARTLTLTYTADWVMDVAPIENQSFIESEWNESAQVLVAKNQFQQSFRDAHAFLSIGGVAAGSEISWTANRDSMQMDDQSLSKETGIYPSGFGAIRVNIPLPAGESQQLQIILGCTTSKQEAIQLASRYQQEETISSERQTITKFWSETLQQIQIETPSVKTNILMNGWLLYQSLACRMWARTAFYQAGGAYGYRDQLQDSLAFLHVAPERTRTQILRHAAHQYVEGDVQHWWHEETEKGIRTRFSDDLLWLPYATIRYLEQTDDQAILDEVQPYLTSSALEPDNHERYEPTVISDQSGDIYDHCIRAIERSLRFGEHGLPLMGIGDWNDGMSRIGAEGRGESVWLAWFQGLILRDFADICEQRGDIQRAQRYRETHQRLIHDIDQHAWDGNWYRRAFHDAGNWIGTHTATEARMDAIAQSWSVLSGMGDSSKVRIAMENFDQQLVNRDLSYIQILAPGFNHSDPTPGYIQGYPPGVRENAGQYTHGVIWSVLAWTQLNEGNKAFELFDILNPINHGDSPEKVNNYRGEPYIMAADITTSEAHKGRAGWTWYTGASGWMYQVMIEGILGIRKRGNQLQIKPCIPKEWPAFTIRYRFDKTVYQIQVCNPAGKQSGISQLRVDGQAKPTHEGVAIIELSSDQEIVQIELTM